MNSPQIIPLQVTTDQAATMHLLLRSDAAIAAAAAAKQADAARRHQHIVDFGKMRTDAQGVHRRALASIEKIQPRLDAAYAAWRTLQDEMAAAEEARYLASWGLDRIDGRLRGALQPFGGEVIDAALLYLGRKQLDTAAALRWAAVRDWRGNKVGVEQVDPKSHSFVARMVELRAELEALRLADVTPAEIAKRCAAATAEADGAPIVKEPAAGDRSLVLPPAGLGVGA